MEPKFQSSFIPKGPLAPTATTSNFVTGKKDKKTSFLMYVAILIFIISTVFAIGVFGYKYYLKDNIAKMKNSLEQARESIQPETINELTRLDNRIKFTKTIISKHRVLTPLFEFLEESTAKTVRFEDFSFNTTQDGSTITMAGEARGYAVLAFQAELFNKSKYFKKPVFSNLSLDDKGNVSFSFSAEINPDLLIYKDLAETELE